jgi:hypothetical protein
MGINFDVLAQMDISMLLIIYGIFKELFLAKKGVLGLFKKLDLA